jgi:hypothetical protein
MLVETDYGAIPERALIAGVINQAFTDASSKTCGKDVQVEAIDFLMTERSDPFFELLDIDPSAARESLVRKTGSDPRYQTFRHALRMWRSSFRFSANGRILAGKPRKPDGEKT